jgi:hypothetical protein
MSIDPPPAGMLDELTVHTADPERYADLLAWHRTRGHDRRRPESSRAWTAEFGQGNRVVALRGFADLDEWWRAAGPAAGGGEEPPAELLASRERRLLVPIRPFRADLDHGSGLCELRIYDIRPGRLDDFARLMLDMLPFRERHSPNAGLWRSASGCVDQLVHMWRYTSLEERARVRTELLRHAEWRDYRDAVLPLVVQVQSSILWPIVG